MIAYDESDENLNESGSEKYIDPSDLITTGLQVKNLF